MGANRMQELKQVMRFGYKLVLFIVVFIGIYALALFTLSKLKVGGNKLVYRAVQGLVWKGGYSYDRFREFDRSKNYDVLVFGSSRANRGIDPVLFEKHGFTLYNLGTDDQTPVNTCVLIKEYVRKEKCRLVILDIYDKVFCQNPLESNSDLIQNLDNDRYAFKMALAARDLRAINQFGVRMMIKNQPPEYRAEGKLYNGFRALNDEFRYSDDRHLYYRRDSHMEAFEETLEYLHKIGMPILLTCQPLPLKPLNHDRFIDDLQPVLKKYGLTVYDFTTRTDLVQPGGFADMSHLNQRGAIRYTDFLLDSLVIQQLKPMVSALD